MFMRIKFDLNVIKRTSNSRILQLSPLMGRFYCICEPFKGTITNEVISIKLKCIVNKAANRDEIPLKLEFNLEKAFHRLKS